MTLGLTGGYCAGKDAVAAILARAGFAIIDVDEVGHEVLQGRRAEVLGAFGPGVAGRDGQVDRRALGRAVFGDESQRAKLEAILHPEMVLRVRERAAAEARAGRDVVVNAAILYRMGLDRMCDAVVFVQARAWRRLLRAMGRDGLSLTQAIQRLASQRDVRLQMSGSGVDTYRVRNDRGLHSLERSVTALVTRLRSR